MNGLWATLLAMAVMAAMGMTMRGGSGDSNLLLQDDPSLPSRSPGSHPATVSALAAAQRRIRELESSNKHLESRISRLVRSMSRLVSLFSVFLIVLLVERLLTVKNSSFDCIGCMAPAEVASSCFLLKPHVSRLGEVAKREKGGVSCMPPFCDR
eukprot:276145-Hanusia_phi.AAC.1